MKYSTEKFYLLCFTCEIILLIALNYLKNNLHLVDGENYSQAIEKLGQNLDKNFYDRF